MQQLLLIVRHDEHDEMVHDGQAEQVEQMLQLQQGELFIIHSGVYEKLLKHYLFKLDDQLYQQAHMDDYHLQVVDDEVHEIMVMYELDEVEVDEVVEMDEIL